MVRRFCLVCLVACGSTPPSATPTEPPPPRSPSEAERAAEAKRIAKAEAARKEQIAGAHRELEDEQSTALAASCVKAKEAPTPEPRCTPTCYAAAAADPRATRKLRGAVVITHAVCTRAEDGETFVIVDEIGADVAGFRGRVPKAHEKESPDAAIVTAVTAALGPEIARGDSVRVTGTWKRATHPATKEALRCTTVSHYAASLRAPLDACGGRGGIACEATGNAAAHGLDVIRLRLEEARRFQAARKDAACQQASLEALAVARGMPRWRQYAQLNTSTWKGSPRYRTRADGVLDEDALFAKAIALGTVAQALHAACGGAANPKTAAAAEQSFHTCW